MLFILSFCSPPFSFPLLKLLLLFISTFPNQRNQIGGGEGEGENFIELSACIACFAGQGLCVLSLMFPCVDI